MRSAGRSGTSVHTSISLVLVRVLVYVSQSVLPVSPQLVQAASHALRVLVFISAQCSERPFGQPSFQLSDLWCHAKRVNRIMRNAHTVFIFCYNSIIIVVQAGILTFVMLALLWARRFAGSPPCRPRCSWDGVSAVVSPGESHRWAPRGQPTGTAAVPLSPGVGEVAAQSGFSD